VQVQERIDDFRKAGADVVAVTFVNPTRLPEYVKSRSWKIQVLADPERRLYQAFGLGQASWRRLLRLRVLIGYIGLMLKGRRPQMAHEDVHQLGGDFVLDRLGRVMYAHPSTDPVDRPDVMELLGAVARAVAADQRTT
jgi:peroxiredoxin